jgi:hypothetical protein
LADHISFIRSPGLPGNGQGTAIPSNGRGTVAQGAGNASQSDQRFDFESPGARGVKERECALVFLLRAFLVAGGVEDHAERRARPRFVDRRVRPLGEHQTALETTSRLIGLSRAPASEPFETHRGHETHRVADGFGDADTGVDVAFATRATKHQKRATTLGDRATEEDGISARFGAPRESGRHLEERVIMSGDEQVLADLAD